MTVTNRYILGYPPAVTSALTEELSPSLRETFLLFVIIIISELTAEPYSVRNV